MDYSAVNGSRISSEHESHPDSEMAEPFNLASDPFKRAGLTPQRDGRSEREARGSPYIHTDHGLNEQSSVGSSHTSAAQQDLVAVVTSDMNEAFIRTPLNGSQNSWNKSVSCAHNGQTGCETFKRFLKHKEHDGRSEGSSSESTGRAGELSSSDLFSCRGSSGNECISVSSGEMVIRGHSLCLEDESLITFSSLEESSVSPPASCQSSESNLLSAALPDVCKTSSERRTKESKRHLSLGETFTLEKSTEKLNEEEEDAAALSPLVPLPRESEGALFMTFICETPTDETQQAKCSVDEAGPQVSEGHTPEHGKTFTSTVSDVLDSDDDIHTSTPVQSTGNNMPKLSYVSPCIDNADSPSVQLVKKRQISASSKGRPAAGAAPSVCKVKKADSQKASKSDAGTARAKVLTRVSQQAALPGAAKPQKPLQVFKNAFRSTPAKVLSRNPDVSAVSKSSVPNGQANERAATSGVTVKQLTGLDAASSHDPHPALKENASAAQSSKSSFRGMQASTSQVSETSCASSAEKSPARSGRVDPKPTPKRDGPSKTGVSSGSASGQDSPSVSRMRSRCSSESLSMSRPPKEKKAGQRVTASFTARQDGGVRSSARAGNLKGSNQHKHVEETRGPADASRGAKKISLVAEPSRSTTAGAQLSNSKGKTQGQASPRPGRGAAPTQPPAASPRPSLPPARQIQGVLERAVSRLSRTVGNAQRNVKTEVSSAGSHRAQTPEEPSMGIKLQQNASKTPQTPSRSSLMGPPLTPAVKLPRKFPGLCQDSKSTSVSGGALQKPTVLKSFVLKARLLSSSAKNSGSAVTTACRSAASTSNGSSASAVSPLKKTNYGKPSAQTTGGAVDRNKPKTSSRKPQQQCSQPAKGAGSQAVAQGSVPQDGGRDQNIQQLKALLTASNRRFQALAIVLQQTLAERDDASRQCRKLSEELVNLKGELACSVHSSECLEREKEELRAALQDATRTLQEEHQKELAELEQRLQAAFKAEWDRVLLTYQEEAKKYKTVMQQQMEDLKADHEALKLQLESSHAEELQSVRQQYEMSMEDLRKVHTQEMQSFEQALKDAEAAVSARIQELTVENKVLLEKLAAEESRRRELGENTQKDSHTLYLEQELESLKVVVDLKNKQLHQQEKKLMEIGKLTEKNVKLDEILIKVQQENEDLKARMEKHAALSRQLSTEQAVLQESLQKESKVNKRLSMENEELLWKLHNGELSSPRRVSPGPTSPSHPFKLQSPRSSVFLSSPPVSPR